MAALCTYFGAAGAAAQQTIASYEETSGSLPPPYAWRYSVTFDQNGGVRTTYCKAYAPDGPDCASRTDALPQAHLAKLIQALAPIARDLAAHPIREIAVFPVGGGTTTARITNPDGGAAILLPAFPIPSDAARLTLALDLLRSFTPMAARDDIAARRAMQN